MDGTGGAGRPWRAPQALDGQARSHAPDADPSGPRRYQTPSLRVARGHLGRRAEAASGALGPPNSNAGHGSRILCDSAAGRHAIRAAVPSAASQAADPRS